MHRLTAAVALALAGLMPLGLDAERGLLAPDPSSPFVLAARHGDALVPVARWDGAGWVHTWPEPSEGDQPSVALDDVPIAWFAGPIARTWWTWPSGTPTRVLGLTRPPGECAQPYLLQTSEHDDARMLAFSTPPPSMSALADLPSTSPTWRELSARMRDIFVAASPVNDPRVKTLPVELLRVGHDASEAASGEARYFVSARQRLSAPQNGGGARDVMLAGWVTRRAGRVVALDTIVWKHWGDGVEEVIPLAIVHVGGRAFWIVEHRYYQSGSIEIHDVSRDRAVRVLATSTGGCGVR